MTNRLVGTGVALVTPFGPEGKIDYLGLEKLINYTAKNGVDYLVVNGTTAESATLNEQEKSDILSFVINITNNSIPIVYGLGGNNTSSILKQIKEIDLTQITALLSVSPYYNKPSQEGIYQHYKEIAEASPVPIILYNVPSRTGANISAATTVRLSSLKNIIGIKEASTDLMQNLEILKNTSSDFLKISGDDMWTLPLIAMGGHGAISVISNAYPEVYSKMVRFALQKNFESAMNILHSLTSLNPLLYEEANPVGVKYLLQKLGICQDFVRLPLVSASESLRGKINLAVPN